MNVHDTLKQAAASYSRGDLPAARRLAEGVLRGHPRHAGALQLAGIVLCQSGELRQGADHLRNAMRWGGDTPGNRFNLARALIELGDLDEAEKLTAGPEKPLELRRLHADVLKAQSRLWEATGEYERIVEAAPDDAESWNNLGNARHEGGDLDGALAALQRARALEPQSPVIHTNLGRVLATMDRHDDSLALLQEAVRLSPGDPAALLELGQALIRMDHSREALVPLATAARLDANDPRIFVAMASAFTDIADRTRAEQALRLAIRADAKCIPAYLNLAILLEQENRIDELEKLAGDAMARGLGGSDIDYMRALLLRRQDRLEEALDLVRSGFPEAIDPAVRAHFIGQAADRLGKTEVAFAAFEEMHRAQAQSPAGLGLDRRAYQREVALMTARVTPEWVASWSDAPPLEGRSPVFLVGFPRSGTTLLDTVLMGHADTHVLEELPILDTISGEIGDLSRLGEMSEDEVVRMRARYYEELHRLSPPPPGKLVIDKNPLSMLRVPLIHRLFPDARIVFTLRHPCDVVLSCFMQNFKLTQAMASFLDLTSGSLLYDRVLAHWQHCRGIFPVEVHDVRYEAMTVDLEAEMRPLLEFLGLPWDEAILDHQRTAAGRGYIRTPSYAQVTEGIYARASGRWERYLAQMAPVLPILAPWVERLGYPSLTAPEAAEGARPLFD